MQLWLLCICLNCNFFMIFYYGVFFVIVILVKCLLFALFYIIFSLYIYTMFASMAQRVCIMCVYCGEFLLWFFIFIILRLLFSVRFFVLYKYS